jgi:myo-inositol-1(or 4)-monophosphatase
VWVVDPIDGTAGFIAGQRDWTIAAALVEEGLPVVGAVFNPACSEMFTARRGGGAYLNGERIAASEASAIENSRMIARRNVFKKSIWTDPWPEMRYLWANSVAYRLALVAAGAAEATISLSEKKEWDVAAAALLVEEAGGRVSGIDGAPFTFNKESARLNGLVAAGQALHQRLIARTRQVATA